MRRFVSLHVLVPGDWTVHRGHALLERIESEIRAVVPGATITAKNKATASTRTSVSGADGLFTIPALEPGAYTVTVSLQGFKTAVLIAGGLHGDHRYVPEDDPINFVPRIRMPVLLVGGRDDFLFARQRDCTKAARRRAQPPGR